MKRPFLEVKTNGDVEATRRRRAHIIKISPRNGKLNANEMIRRIRIQIFFGFVCGDQIYFALETIYLRGAVLLLLPLLSLSGSCHKIRLRSIGNDDTNRGDVNIERAAKMTICIHNQCSLSLLLFCSGCCCCRLDLNSVSVGGMHSCASAICMRLRYWFAKKEKRVSQLVVRPTEKAKTKMKKKSPDGCMAVEAK